MSFQRLSEGVEGKSRHEQLPHVIGGRIAGTQREDAAYCNRCAIVVCVFVCLLVTTVIRSRCRLGRDFTDCETFRMPHLKSKGMIRMPDEVAA